MYEQVFMSHVDTLDTSADDEIVDLGSAEDDDDRDTKATKSGPTIQEADAQAPRAPPGLVAHGCWIPPEVFYQLTCDTFQQTTCTVSDESFM